MIQKVVSQRRGGGGGEHCGDEGVEETRMTDYLVGLGLRKKGRGADETWLVG